MKMAIFNNFGRNFFGTFRDKTNQYIATQVPFRLSDFHKIHDPE